MTKYSTRWLSLLYKLSQTKKSLSLLKRKADILAECNSRLVKDNTAWAECNSHLVKDNIAWAKSYNNLAANHSELLSLYNRLLERSKLNDCEGTSAE
jgi:hypothetical protein